MFFAPSRLLIFLALLPAIAAAQFQDLRMPVVIDADNTEIDGRESITRFEGFRLSQGSTSIEADHAQTSEMKFEDSIWRFAGNVVFDVDQGHITCDSADLEFKDFQLQVATIEGSPATFEFRRPDNGQPTVARARRLHYNVPAGTIEFSGEAMITEGGNQVSAESLVYNIREQRINAVSTGNGDDRVQVTFTPPAEDASEETDRDDAP